MRADPRDLLLLRALCQTADLALLQRACRLLSGHRWAQGEQLVIYESCAALAGRGVCIEPRALAVQLTRAGFPDVDLTAFFSPLASPDGELSRLLSAREGRPE